MKLSLWLYEHRHGTDLLRVLAPDDVIVTPADVVRICGIDWEGAKLLRSDERDDDEIRDDEFLSNECDIPVGENPPDAMLPHVSVWSRDE